MLKSEVTEEENTSKVEARLTVERIEDGVAYCDVELKVKEQAVNLQAYVTALQGITYKDWIKLKMAVDRGFQKSIGEFERTLELTDTDTVSKLIRSQFE